MLFYLKKIYDLLPKKHLFFLRYIPNRLLFGKSYFAWKSKVSFDKNLIDKNLFETLNYVRDHTCFGKDYIPEKFELKDVKKVLESLPTVTSYDLAINLSYYISDEYNSFNSYTATTGGTGGSPTTLLFANELYGIEWAHVHHIWSFAGYDRKRDTKLTLRGKVLKSNKLVEYSPIYNELVVDVFKVNNNNFDEFLKAIEPYNIQYIHGYPSLVKEYMTYFESHNYIPQLKAILLTSEGTDINDKQYIADFFGCQVLSFYGQSERALIAVDIESNGIYKVYTSYGYPRIIEGELIITSFVNRALPLLNYKIGDGAELIEDEHCIYLKNLSSRRGKDFIYLTKEKKIPSTALGLHIPIQNEILYYQFHQKEFAKIEIRVLPKMTSPISPEEILAVFGAAMKERLQEFDVTLRLVKEDEIKRSHRAKMILLVQELTV
jgi:phenylacetate-CoA ligase